MTQLPDIKKLDPELNEILIKDFKGERTGFVQVGPEKWLFPVKYEKFAADLLNFEVRADDTWIVTYPRSGTTLTSELMWLILNNVDLEIAKKTPLTERFPFFEFYVTMHKDVVDELRAKNSAENANYIDNIDEISWVALNTAPSPRCIKTHLPLQLLPKNLLTSGAKVIYVARNPKDVAVSYYHLQRLNRFQHYLGDLEKFWDYFEKNLLIGSPFWNHVLEAWNNRHSPNLQFLFYEEFINSPSEYILKVAKFLNKELTEDQIVKLVDHLKFDNFKNNAAVNLDIAFRVNGMTSQERTFIRKGKVGAWVEEFSPELTARADKWTQENLKNTDLRFPI